MHEDEAALLRTVHQNPRDATPRLVLADYYDDNDRPQEAAMHRYIAEPTDRHRDLFVGQHGGRTSDAAHQLSHHIYKQAFAHGDKFPAADEPPYDPAYRVARNAGYAADEGSVGPGRMDRHHRAAEGHAEEARNYETLPSRHNLPPASVDAAAELHTLHTAAEKLHRHARNTLRGVA